MARPDLSLLIAARHAHAFVAEAVTSVFACGEGVRIEIIIASDDGSDYSLGLPADPRLRFTPPGPDGSGAYAARNRALALAEGAYVMLLDADDLLAGPADAIARAVACASPAGAVVVPTEVVDPTGAVVRRIPTTAVHRFGLSDWADAFASLHVIVRRDLVHPFRPYALIDDVLFDLSAVAAAGGEVAVAEVLTYRYRLRPGQMTDTEGVRFEAEYARALAEIAREGAEFGPAAPAVAAVLRRWRAMNRLVGGGRRRQSLGDYHRAVAAYLAGHWPAGRRLRQESTSPRLLARGTAPETTT